MKWTWLAATALVVAGCGGGANTPAPTATPTHTPTAESARVAPLCERAERQELGRAENPAITELSGLARTQDGRFWTHNDSGDGPRVFELDTTGAFLREVAVQGAEAYDWEDIAIRGDTLYVADIGDNLGARESVQVYRFELPEGPTAQATTLTLRYPDRPRNAEALLVDPRTGELAIITKDFSGVAEVFRLATHASSFPGAHPSSRYRIPGRTCAAITRWRFLVLTKSLDGSRIRGGLTHTPSQSAPGGLST